MTLNNEQLRLGIIEKLKECNAYIDNELPDYIMVMLVNKKTFHQISNDLQLFLGEHTSAFMEWLQDAATTGNITGSKKSKADHSGKEQARTKTDLNRISETGADEVSEKDSTNEANVKKTKRRRSEDELELHPMIDWEEEREGGGGKEGKERVSSRKPSSRSSESKSSSQRSGGEVKLSRTSTGDEGEGKERREGRKSLVSDAMEKSGKDDGEYRDPAVKHTRTIKLSKSDDLRVLIARKKGERSAPPTYLTSRRYSLSGSEGESEEGEEEGEGDVGKKGGLSSVVKVPERVHLSMEGGSRLLQRAIKGLGAPKQRPEKQRRGVREERGGREERGVREERGGREERGVREERGGREERGERAGAQGKKRKGRSTKVAVEAGHRVKRVAVSGVEESGRVEGEKEEEEEEQEVVATEEEDILPLSVKDDRAAAEDEPPSDDTSRKVELAVITALRKVLPGQKELTDLRQLITRQREKTDSENETQFVVTMDGLDERYEVMEGGEDVEEEGEREGEEEKKTHGAEGDPPSRGSGLPERCRFWPNCRKGDSCPYHHPSAQCRAFPNCKYGNKCLFIHPQCKFDSRCKRSDCRYLHTAPRHIHPRALPTPPVFPPPSLSPAMMKFPRPVSTMWSPHKSRFPNKSSLTWTPGKAVTHVSQRQFAVADEETTPMPVK